MLFRCFFVFLMVLGCQNGAQNDVFLENSEKKKTILLILAPLCSENTILEGWRLTKRGKLQKMRAPNEGLVFLLFLRFFRILADLGSFGGAFGDHFGSILGSNF